MQSWTCIAGFQFHKYKKNHGHKKTDCTIAFGDMLLKNWCGKGITAMFKR